MAIATILICVFCTIVCYKRNQDTVNPGFLMSGLWAVITLLYYLQLFDIKEAGEITFLMITLGIICFSIGCGFSRRHTIVFKIGTNSRAKGQSLETLRIKTITYLGLFCALLMLVPAFKSILLIRSQGVNLSYIRYNVTLYNNSYLNLIYNYFAKPFTVAIIPLVAIAVFTKKTNKAFIIFALIIIAESVLIDGGRFVIYFLACNLFIAYHVFGFSLDSRTEKKRNKRIILLGVISSLSIIWVISISRGIQDIWKSIYFYMCGCVPHLDIRINDVLTQNSITYGYASNNGIVEFVFTMLENLGFNIPASYIHAKSMMNVENVISITKSGHGSFNAFVGPFYYFFLDFRWAGIIIGMFIYGYVSFYIYKFSNKKRIRYLAIYMLIAQGILSSMVRFQFNSMYYVLGFIYIIICTKRDKSLLE